MFFLHMTYLFLKTSNIYLLGSTGYKIRRDIINVIAVCKPDYLICFSAAINIEYRILGNTLPTMCLVITFEGVFTTGSYLCFRLAVTGKYIDQLQCPLFHFTLLRHDQF